MSRKSGSVMTNVARQFVSGDFFNCVFEAFLYCSDEKIPQVAAKWDDEDAIPDSWDADEVPQAPKPKPSAPPKMSAKEKIALKTEKKNKIVEDLKKKQMETTERKLTELEREELSKEQERHLIMDSFGVSDLAPRQTTGVDFSKVSTKQDFLDLLDKLVEKFKNLESSPHYSSFAEDLIRHISLPMDLDNLKEISVSINALVAEKQKLVKNKTKKKTVKAKLVVERDVNDYDLEDFDDGDYEDYL